MSRLSVLCLISFALVAGCAVIAGAQDTAVTVRVDTTRPPAEVNPGEETTVILPMPDVPPSGQLLIVETDNGKDFEVRQGDRIVIRLAENPTTGYRWEIADIDEQIVAFQDSDFSIETPGLIGGGGIRTFIFKAQSAGTVSVQLTLKRPWEDNSIDRFGVTIRVLLPRATEDEDITPIPDNVDDAVGLPNPTAVAELRAKSLAEYAEEIAQEVVAYVTWLNGRITDIPVPSNDATLPTPEIILVRLEVPTPEEVESFVFDLMADLGGLEIEMIDFEATTVGLYSDTFAQQILDALSGLNDAQKKLLGLQPADTAYADDLARMALRVVHYIASEAHREFSKPVVIPGRPESDGREQAKPARGYFYCPALGQKG